MSFWPCSLPPATSRSRNFRIWPIRLLDVSHREGKSGQEASRPSRNLALAKNLRHRPLLATGISKWPGGQFTCRFCKGEQPGLFGPAGQPSHQGPSPKGMSRMEDRNYVRHAPGWLGVNASNNLPPSIVIQPPWPRSRPFRLISMTPSAKWPLKMSKTCVFHGRQTPFRHFSWRAEGGAEFRKRLRGALFWPSANPLHWRREGRLPFLFAGILSVNRLTSRVSIPFGGNVTPQGAIFYSAAMFAPLVGGVSVIF
jgi:hypothetical protein